MANLSATQIESKMAQLLTNDVIFNELRANDEIRKKRMQEYRRTHKPSEQEARVARMKRARGLPYDKWAVGESEY